MKFRNIKTIIAREYLTKVKKKSFLLTTFLVPVFFAAMCILPSVIMFMAKDTGKKVAVIDQSGIVMPYMVDTESVDYSDYSSESPEDMKTRFEELGLDVLVVVSPLDTDYIRIAICGCTDAGWSGLAVHQPLLRQVQVVGVHLHSAHSAFCISAEDILSCAMARVSRTALGADGTGAYGKLQANRSS